MDDRALPVFHFQETSRDSLTGVWRRSVLNDLNKAFEIRTEDEIWSLLIIDIDHFKLINDVYGHLMGDKVLKQLTDILMRNTRLADVLMRYGGDEFVVVFPGCEQSTAMNYPQRVLEELDAVVFPQDICVSISMGIAESNSDDRKLDNVIARADKALYQAKESGRGRISFYVEPDKALQTKNPTFEHFVDRQHEQRTLRRLLDESITGTSRLVVISGEPGIGKSQLVQELKHYSRFKGCSFLEDKCSEFGVSESYALIIKPLQETIISMDNEQITMVLDAVPPLHPSTASLFPALGFHIESDITQMEQKQLKYRIFEDIASILNSFSGIIPVVFLIDDLQWMSTTDFDLFGYLVRNTPENRILFIATMRSPFEDYPEVFKQLNVLRTMTDVVLIDLERLEDEYSNHMVMFSLHDPDISKDILKKIVQQSGGNPFFLRELVKSLHERGSIRADDSGRWLYNFADDTKLPESITELISKRFNQLEDMSRELLGIGALAVGSFSFDLLSKVSKKSQIRVMKALDKPLQMGLIIEELTRENQLVYKFVQNAVKNYVYSNLPETTGSIFHLRMGEYYEKQYLEGREDIITGVAHHYCSSPDLEKAIIYSLLAARSAVKCQVINEAIRWLEKYVSLIDPEKETHEDIFYAYSKLGLLYSQAGQCDKAEQILKKAQEVSSVSSEKGEVFHAVGNNLFIQNKYAEARANYTRALQIQDDPVKKVSTLYILAYIDSLEGHIKQGFIRLEQMKELIDSCVSDTEMENMLSSYYSCMGLLKMHAGSRSESLEYYDKALEILQKHQNLNKEAATINNVTQVLMIDGNYEKRLELLRKAEQIEMKTGRAFALSLVYVNIGLVYLALNQQELAREYCNHCVNLANKIGYNLTMVYAKFLFGLLFENEENFNAAESMYREAMEIAESIGLNIVMVYLKISLTELMIEMGKHNEASEIVGSLSKEKDKDYFKQTFKMNLSFLKGLILYHSDTEKNQTSQAEVEKLFKKALESESQLVFVTRIKVRYYLARSLYEQRKTDEYHSLIEQTVKLLNDHISEIKSVLFRESFSESSIVKLLLDEYHYAESDPEIKK